MPRKVLQVLRRSRELTIFFGAVHSDPFDRTFSLNSRLLYHLARYNTSQQVLVVFRLCSFKNGVDGQELQLSYCRTPPMNQKSHCSPPRWFWSTNGYSCNRLSPMLYGNCRNVSLEIQWDCAIVKARPPRHRH